MLNPAPTPDVRDTPSGVGRFICVDTEAIGFLPQIRYNDRTSLHVICARDMQTGEVFVFFDKYEDRDPEHRVVMQADGSQDGSLEDGARFILESEAWVAHNSTGYDVQVLAKVFPHLWKKDNLARREESSRWFKFFPNWLMDTYVMSTLLNPDRRPPPQAFAMGAGAVGAHSIEAHGIRMGRFKPEHEDWSYLSDDMLHRVKEDVQIGSDLFWYLAKGEWQEHLDRGGHRITGLGIIDAYRMELQVACTMARQAELGFRLDIRKAYARYNELQQKLSDTEKGFRPKMPMRIKKKSASKDYLTGMLGKATKALEALDGLGAVTEGLLDNLEAWLNTEPEVSHVSYNTTYFNPTNKGGNYSANTKKAIPEAAGNIWDYGGELWQAPVVGAFTPVSFEEIPLGNRDAVKQILYEYGWLGVNYNDTEQKHLDDTGELPYPWSGKIDEDSLTAWKERQEIPEWAEGIAAWYVLTSRSNQILNNKDYEYFQLHKEWPRQANGKHFCKGLLPRAFSQEYQMEAQEFYEKFNRWPTEEEDGEWRVPAVAISIGTNTFRMRHRNVVNIPSRGLSPLRDLFIAGNGKMILGCDGAGLELRMLAHFMNDPKYIDVVLNGDIHSYNQNLAGLPTRDMAKTFVYAFLYGSGIANLAAVTGMSSAEMEARVLEFKERLPALANLVTNLEKVGAKYGHLLAVDGRFGRIRFRNGEMLVHTILNVLLQMTGSLCMKWGLVLAEDKMLEEEVALGDNGYPMYVANVHDEIQMEVLEEEVLTKEYLCLSENWKQEEDKAHIDAEGRLWSAPTIIQGNPKEDKEILVRRRYHRAGAILAEQMTEAGKFLGIRIPLAGEYQIGHSWAETH